MSLKSKLKKFPALVWAIKRARSLALQIVYSDLKFKARIYRRVHGRDPDMQNPQSFTEKLMWSSENYRDDRFVEYADKYLVRKHVASVIGEEYLIPLYDVVDKASDLDFDKYPNRFVLNATHGSNMVILCNDKSKLDLTYARKTANTWLHRNYYHDFREWHYKYIKPRVLVTQNISSADGTPPWDYKFFCFGGKPFVVGLDLDRFGGVTMRNVYDMNWVQMKDVRITRPQDFTHEYPVPKNFELMKTLAEKLAQGFEHVRVDFYNVDGKIYFGELTFLHAASGINGNISPWEFDLEMGRLFNLPKRNISSWQYKG